MPSTTSEFTDAELISAVRSGDLESYGLLFARHRDAATRLARQLVPGPDADDLVAESFSRVMAALQDGKGPDEFFRAYLLTSIRRLHIDKIRAGKRLKTTGDESELDRAVDFVDPAEMKFEQKAAADAFASLPERWQLVLWHLDVEQQKPAQVAPLLGMTPNSVSALAYRAREGLRVAYLQGHLAPTLDEACKSTTSLLGQYVRKALRTRDTAAVESHLDTCSRCSGLHLELVEVNGDLSGLLAPALLGAAAAGYLGTTSGLVSVGATLGALPGKLQSAASNNPAAAVAAGVVTLTVVGAAVGVGLTTRAADAPPAATGKPAPSTAPPAPAPSSDSPAKDKSKQKQKDTAADLPAPLVPSPAPPVATSPPQDDPNPVKPSPTTRPTSDPKPTPTPTPTPSPTPHSELPTTTDYSVSVAFANEAPTRQRQVTIQVLPNPQTDVPAGNLLTVTMGFSADQLQVTYNGGLGPGWDCTDVPVPTNLTQMTCTRLQTGPTVPPLQFSVTGINPTVTTNISAADNDDPNSTNNSASLRAEDWQPPVGP